MPHLHIETKRLVLRSPDASDAPAYAAIFSDPQNTEFDPQHDGPEDNTVEKYEEQIAQFRTGNERGEKAMVSVCLKNEDGTPGAVIGMGGFPWLPVNANGRPGNTGVLIDWHHARKGYGSEVLFATLNYGFDDLGFETIEQSTQDLNKPYRNLMKSMGLDKYGEKEGPDRKGYMRWNYVVNKAQWSEVKQQLAARRD